MLYIFSMIMAVAAFFFIRRFGKYIAEGEEHDSKKVDSAVWRAAVAILVAWAGLHTILGSVNQIPAGHVGVVYEFGAITGQVGEGLQFVAPWKSVTQASIQVQGHKFNSANNNTLTAFSKETQEVLIEATLNIRVSPIAIQDLYRTVGPNYFSIVVAPRVAQSFKDETVKYNSVDIAPNREAIRQAVRNKLESELSSAYSIEVVDMLLDNIDFQPGFKAAIEAKQIATQQALEEEQKVVKARHMAAQAVEKAMGEGSAILVVAEKQAEANQKLSQSLTPALIQYALIQKLGDKIQVMILPPGQNFILGADMLRGTSVVPSRSDPVQQK